MTSDGTVKTWVLFLSNTMVPRASIWIGIKAICRDAQAQGDTIALCGDEVTGSKYSLPESISAPSKLRPRLISFPLAEADLQTLIQSCEDGIAFLPLDGDWACPDFGQVGTKNNGLLPWAIPAVPADRTSQIGERPVKGWVMSAALCEPLLRSAETVNCLGLSVIVDRVRAEKLSVQWLSAKVLFKGDQPIPEAGEEAPIRSDARVLALVPHFGCEEWLEQCLMSLTDQTRPLDGIAVIDDASREPPIELCSAFQNVTLLQSPSTVGPYRLVQSVIRQTSFDAYMFQDADDWSACNRLEILLAAAERHGADLVGCQQARLFLHKSHFCTMTFPLDVNWGLAESPSHGLAHPTSLVSRRLLERTAGFSSGMGFGADSEFLNRAVFAGRVINTPYLSYFWRGRATSLTNSPDTGHASSIRQNMKQTLYRYYWAALRDYQSGQEVFLKPLCPSDPIELRHVCGPCLPTD